jgi:hypothetical protein
MKLAMETRESETAEKENSGLSCARADVDETSVSLSKK